MARREGVVSLVMPVETGLEAGRKPIWYSGVTCSSRFRYFMASPEIIHLAAMMYVGLALSILRVEDLLYERQS